MLDECHINYEIFNTKCFAVTENSGNVSCLSFVYPLTLNRTDFCFISVFFNGNFTCYDNTASLVDECNVNMNLSE